MHGRASTAGTAFSFYAAPRIAAAIKACIGKHFGTDHGAKSRWFIEAAQRDLRARGMPDGSEPASKRAELVNKLVEAAQSLTDDALEAKVNEIRGVAMEAAGTTS